MVDISRLQRFLKPENIAIIGGGWCDEVVRQCQKIGFPGNIWAVNQNRPDLAGLPCVKHVDDLPGVPDQHGAVPVEQGVAILSQSGNIAVNITMQQRGLPLAYMVSLGNQAQCGVSEFFGANLPDAQLLCPVFYPNASVM